MPRLSAQLPGHRPIPSAFAGCHIGHLQVTGCRKMAIFTCLNLYITGASQLTTIKFGTLLEPLSVHFRTKARWDRVNHSRAINAEVRYAWAQ